MPKRRHFPYLLILMGLPMLLSGQTTIVPEFLQATEINKEPYKYNGLLKVGTSLGSASVVGDGVIATAAHVIYDDEALAWQPIGIIRYYPRFHTNNPTNPSPSSKVFAPVGFIRWTSYSTRVKADDSGPGLSSMNTFNLDLAVGHIAGQIRDETVTTYPEVNVDAEEDVGVLRDNRTKMLVGYPNDSDFIGSGLRGLMHRTAPADYFSLWGGIEEIAGTWRDSENFWTATYDFEGVTTYGGNSGGPIYYLDDEDRWVMAGVIVGSRGSRGMIVRAIDENAWSLIDEAMNTRGTNPLKRVTNLTATTLSATAVRLQWADQSTEEAGYRVFRLDNGLWESIATLEANAFEYQDVGALPGRAYQYTVQPFGSNDRRRPKSNVVKAETPGINVQIGAHLQQPWFNLSTRGDSNWFVDEENRLRAGFTRSLGASSLVLTIIGPGTLSFEWSVSSEANPDYNNPFSPLENQIYDAAHLLLNGEPVVVGNKPVFLSGEVGPKLQSLQVPSGSHTIEWAYIKDPYSSEGEDTAFLYDLHWGPSASDPYPVFGGFAYEGSDWHGSSWFGAYAVGGLPWVGHLHFGWIYLRPGNGTHLNFYSPDPALGDLYTTPSLFPYLYHYARGTWVYYVKGSGQFGSGVWFYDLAVKDYFRVN